MKREADLLAKALDFTRERSNMLNAHLIKARVAAYPLDNRQRHLDTAIAEARAVIDELLTTRVALGWHRRKGDAA